MNDKPLTDREKQFTVLPNETDPKKSLAKASQAINKALTDVKKSRNGNSNRGFK